MWWAKSLITVEYTIGLLLMLFITPETGYLLYLAAPLTLVSTIGLIVLNIKTSDLDPKNKGVWINLASSACSLGQQLWLLYRVMPNRTWFWVMFLLFQPFSIFRTFCLTPKSNTTANGVGWKTRHDQVVRPPKTENDNLSLLEKLKGLSGALFNPALLGCCFWYVAADIRNQEALSSYQAWLNWAAETDQQVTNFTDLAVLFSLLGIPVGVVNGFLIDKTARTISDKTKYNLQAGQIIASLIWMVFNQICSLLMSLIFSFQSVGIQTYFLLLIALLFRCTLFSTRNLFVAIITPKPIFARIFGYVNLYGFLAPFIIPVLTELRNSGFDGNFLYEEFIFYGIGIFGLICPIFVYFYIFYLDKEFKILGESKGLKYEVQP